MLSPRWLQWGKDSAEKIREEAGDLNHIGVSFSSQDIFKFDTWDSNLSLCHCELWFYHLPGSIIFQTHLFVNILFVSYSCGHVSLKYPEFFMPCRLSVSFNDPHVSLVNKWQSLWFSHLAGRWRTCQALAGAVIDVGQDHWSEPLKETHWTS